MMRVTCLRNLLQLLPLLITCSGSIAESSQALELLLPVDLADAGYQAYGIAPFGYHVAEHRYDGHPGFDIEFIPGRKVRAAHGGIFRYTVDAHDPMLKSVTIEFQDGGINYQTFYTNIAALEAGIDNGVQVATGQVFGTPGSVVRNLGNGNTVTYAMTHFQLADNRVNYGLSNVSAISPETYFTEASTQALRQIWRQSQYHQMICEPFLSTSRGVVPNPVIIRRWLAAPDSGAPDIEFLCDFSLSDPNNSYRYRMIDHTDTVLESGTVVVSAVVGGTSAVDFMPAGAGKRLGVIYVKDETMQLAYSEPDSSRPIDLSAALQYATMGTLTCASTMDALCFGGNTSPYAAGDSLALSLSIDWSKLHGPPAQANLWLALQLSSGELMFRHADGRWHPEADLFWRGISDLSTSIEVITLVLPPESGPGNFTFYALLTENSLEVSALAQQPLSNLASALIYLGP